jgi:hypothetical protein
LSINFPKGKTGVVLRKDVEKSTQCADDCTHNIYSQLANKINHVEQDFEWQCDDVQSPLHNEGFLLLF